MQVYHRGKDGIPNPREGEVMRVRFHLRVDSQVHPNTSISLSNSVGHVRLSLGKCLSGGEGAGPSREKGRAMEGKRRQKRYRRLDRAERAAIQNGLERGWSCRRMARELGRSPSTVADEVSRNRTVAKGPGKGECF